MAEMRNQPSGINPLATAYELQHYLSIATPAVIAVDAALLPRVEAALDALASSKQRRRPALVIIEDGHQHAIRHLPQVRESGR